MDGIARRAVGLILGVVVLLVGGCVGLSPERVGSANSRLGDMMAEAAVGNWVGESLTSDRSQAVGATGMERRSGLQLSRQLRMVHQSVDGADAGSFATPLLAEGDDTRKARFAHKMSPAITSIKAVRRIDVRVARVPAQAFFASLVSEDPNVNMVVHPDVAGVISLELKSVSVDEVVELACEMYQFDCRFFTGHTAGAVRGYKIFPRQLATQTYRVDFLPVVRRGSSETVVSSGNRKESVATMGYGKDQYGREQNSSVTNSVNAGSSIKTDYSSNFWDDLEKTVRSILKLDLALSAVTEHVDVYGRVTTDIERKRFEVKEKGVQRGITHTQPDDKGKEKIQIKEFTKEEEQKQVTPDEAGTTQLAADIKGIMVNRQAGLITVRAFPKEHQEIAAFLEQLRNRSQRQVILEAKILEVELSDGFQFGVDWLAINKGLGSSRFPPLLSEPSGGTTFLANQSYQVGVGNPVADFAQPFTQAFIMSQKSVVDPVSLAFREHDFVGFINLLQQQGHVQVLSSPRIATINNQKAVIKVGSDEFFITGLDSGSVIGSGEAARVTDPTAVFTSMFTGVSLDVTPQIGEGDMITLHVHPMVTEVEDKNKNFVINNKPQSLPLALSRTRETDSIVRVRSGDVAVIGGLMKDSSVAGESRLPLLGDIPVVGALFGRTEKRWKKSELVILLRPVLVGR